MIRTIFLLVLIMITSCEKDEIIPNKIITPTKIYEIKEERKTHTKKRKFRFFRKKKYKVAKSF